MRTAFLTLLILSSLPVWAGPGLDVRPQMSAAGWAADDTFQNLDLLLTQAANLRCEGAEAHCTGKNAACGQFNDAIACIDDGEVLGCNWSCE